MAKVILKGIKKRYSGNSEDTIKNCSINIEDKDFIVLVGPSGCGKSTILRMIAGLEEITEGELYIGEDMVNTVSPTDRDIAMVFQNYALYPHMTAHQNMAFGLKNKRTPKDVIEQKIKKAAALLDIEDILKTKPKHMSGGQRQRVALGRAIVREPKVFLMDEPLSNLDAKLRVHMRSEITKLHKELQTTFIYVTHDQTEAMTMGTQIVVLKDGNIMQVATPQEAYDRPANLFVAQFIGSPQMNVISGEVVENNGDYSILTDDKILIKTTPEKSAALKENGYKGKKIYWGIRPEYIQEETQNFRYKHYSEVTGKVVTAEMNGAETFLHVDMAGHPVVARVDSHLNKKVGDQVRFHIPSECIHTFDSETHVAV